MFDNEKVINQINIFIGKIKDKYKDLYIDYYYDEEDGMYVIWHNSDKLEFENKDFTEYAGLMMHEILDSHGIDNYFFAYDYLKSKQLEEKQSKNISYSININYKGLSLKSSIYNAINMSIDMPNKYTINYSYEDKHSHEQLLQIS